jgi:hypothetical protein
MPRFTSSRLRRGILVALWASGVCCLVIASPRPAWSWGPLGHRVVARIAQREIGDRARSRLAFYLGKDVGIEDAAVWANDIHILRPETAQWHFIRIPPSAGELDLETQCPEGECITVKLREFEGIARLGIRERSEIEEAAKFLLHLIGDLHQPLHAGYIEDQGGEKTPVVLAGRSMSLYEAWDSALLEQLGSDDAAIADRLAQQITDEQRKRWQEGNLRDWTWESHLLAARLAYGALPAGTPKNLNEDYVSQAAAVIEEQLQKAGVRLAMILDQVWP